MRGTPKSYLLVIIQFACLFGLAFTGPVIARNPVWLVVEILGLAVGVWAIVAMRFFNFNVTPDVKIDGFMVEQGPYRWIRHPMYASLLIIGVALVADTFSWLRLAILVVLAVDLVVKLTYEESLLQQHYPAYADYMKRTKRLIPGLY